MHTRTAASGMSHPKNYGCPNPLDPALGCGPTAVGPSEIESTGRAPACEVEAERPVRARKVGCCDLQAAKLCRARPCDSRRNQEQLSQNQSAAPIATAS